MQLECSSEGFTQNGNQGANSMIVITNQVFIGEIECIETIQFDSVDEYIQYLEYHKDE